MSGFLVTATVAPLLRDASLRSEQVSQLVLGEGAAVLAVDGDMLQLRTLLDDYVGWTAAGYGVQLPVAEVETWLADADWSQGALLSDRRGMALRAPHRARLVRESEGMVQLPTGDSAEILAGAVVTHSEMVAASKDESPVEWAWREFAGTPYLWGGVTGAGIDCSGLVQNTFLARGKLLPRDAADQSAQGSVIDFTNATAGDLLFFRARDSERVAHVALLDHDEQIVHSTVDCGGVVRESIEPGARAHALMSRLVSVRRIA